MHELSIALNIVEVASEEAVRHEGRVTAVHLQLGELAGVVKDALLSAWELARSNSPLAEAELLVEDIPVVAYCPACQAEQNIVSIQQWTCARCGAAVQDVIRGRELQIVALELDV